MGIDQEDMTVFLTVARDGSFGRAASSLLLAQPSVSERMARLERTLGERLFVRGARGTTLTDAGERLRPYAQRFLDLCEEAGQTVRRGGGLPPVRLGVHATFAHRGLPIVLSALGDEQRTVTVRDAHSDEVVAMLLDDVIDVGFVLPGARPQPLRYVALEADPVIAVCAPDHPLAGRSVPLSGLAEHRLALNRWGAGAEAFIRRMEEIGLPERRRTECTDGHTALGLARDHHHVALLTASIASPALTAGQVTAVTLRGAPRWTVPLAFAYHGRVHNDPLIATIRSVIAARVHAEGRTARARPITR